MKFVPGVKVLDSDSTVHFSNVEEATRSQLARDLFHIEGVESVMFGRDFITISKRDDDAVFSWDLLKPQIFATILDFFSTNLPVMSDEECRQGEANPDESELVKQITEILDTYIRPVVQGDGGDIIFKSFDEKTGVVKLKLQGSCRNCPSSTVTLKNSAMNTLKFFIPSITDVEEVGEDAADGESDAIFRKLEKQLKVTKREDTEDKK